MDKKEKLDMLGKKETEVLQKVKTVFDERISNYADSDNHSMEDIAEFGVMRNLTRFIDNYYDICDFLSEKEYNNRFKKESKVIRLEELEK